MNLPARTAPVPLDSFYSQYVFVGDGCRTPRAVSSLTAHCADPGVCDALVLSDADERHHWPELRVVGKAVGATEVVVDLVHPGSHQREQHRIAVSFTAALSEERLAVGARIPATTSLEHAEGTGTRGRCTEDPSSRQYVEGGGDRAVRVFRCDPLIALPDGTRRHRQARGMAPAEDYVLCATLDPDGKVSSLTSLEAERSWPHPLVTRHVEGAPAEKCQPVAGHGLH